MPRPISIKDETIIDAARAVFLERGFAATTAEVAERAGVSEGTLFNRFRSKAELFQAAMRPQFEAMHWATDLAERVGRGDLREQLVEIAGSVVEFMRKLMPLIMMSWSNTGSNGLPATLCEPNPPPLRELKQLAAYFEAEIRLGRVRRVDPEILARMFIGSVQQYVFFEVVLKSRDELPLPLPIYLRGIVAVLLDGCSPDSEPSTR
ncbi:MAG: TetR/AcrR family transcriptional regulator [Nannocystaceae bacterium]